MEENELKNRIASKAVDPSTYARTILVVDDEDYIVQVHKRMIEREGYIVLTALSGQEALEIVREEHEQISLMITDLRMPVMDGITLIEKVREITSEFEIIVNTGYGTMELVIEAIQAGANDFVLKPTDREVFLMAINRSMEKKGLKENLSARTQQLITAEKMASLGLLATGIAHEINNPTTFIKSNLQLIGEYIKRLTPRLEEIDKKENQEFISNLLLNDFPQMIEEALTGTDRIQNIVAGIKHYAHLGDEKFDKDIDIREVISQSINLVKAKLRKNVTISESYMNLKEIKGHFSKLEQVFVNLLVNASDSITEKVDRKRAEGDTEFTGLVDVSATVIEGEGGEENTSRDYLILTFFDNGEGIPESKISKIFDPFFTTKSIGEGTGLGLYICHDIISQHGGEITVQSDPGEGTAFMIKFPVMSLDGASAEEEAEETAT